MNQKSNEGLVHVDPSDRATWPTPLGTDYAHAVRIAEKIDRAASDGVLHPAFQAASVIDAFRPGKGEDRVVDMLSLADKVARMAETIRSGNLGDIEALLIAQAVALSSIFEAYSVQAAGAPTNERADQLLLLALKAQSGSRATLATLVDLKLPRTTVIARQANLASGHQQVNNEAPRASHNEGSDRC